MKVSQRIIYLLFILTILLIVTVIIHLCLYFSSTESNLYYYHLNDTVKMIGVIL